MKTKPVWVAVAAVAGLVAVLVLFAVLRFGTNLLGPADPLRKSPPTVVVEVSYPGANARVIADTVAAPIEQQVNGVEGAVHLRSCCGDDGSYRLVITFVAGTDLDIAQVLIQNRISLAFPVLPEAVQRTGPRVHKKSPAVRALLVLHSPAGRFDELYLGNYAAVNLRDELVRVPGVGDVALLGSRDYGLRVRLDPDKLAARGLSAAAVIKALEEQNIRAAGTAIADAPGLDPNFDVKPNGRLASAEDLGGLVVQTAPGGTVCLRDVAEIEFGANAERGGVRFDGRPAIALAIHPLGPRVDARSLDEGLATALQRLRDHLPEGLVLESAFDFRPSAPDAVLADVTLPAGATAERIMGALEQCDVVVRSIPGVTHSLVAAEDPFAAPAARPCILVGIEAGMRDADRQRIAGEIRDRLGNAVPGAAVRVNDLGSSRRATPGAYPIAFAVCDTSDAGAAALADRADRTVRRLSESPLLTDVGASPATGQVPQLHIDIDRRKAADLGLTMADINKELQAALGAVALGEANRAGRGGQIRVQVGAAFRDPEVLRHTRVANKNGELVPLSAVASIQEAVGPAVVERLDLSPAVEISGNPAPGVSLAEARAFCERIAGEEAGTGFRVVWLGVGR